MRNILSFHKKIGWKPGANTLLYRPLTENANDYSGNGNNGTAYSSVSFSSNGAYFSGSSYNTNFIDFPSSFYPGTSFTVSLRIKKGENNRELRMFSDWGPSYRRILWALTSSGYTNLLFGNGSTSQSEWLNIQAYSANTWYNYVLVKDGANATIYRDGVLVGTHTFSYNSSPGGLSGGEYGIGNIRTSPSSSSMGTGYIKDYIIENKLWTAEEVSDYYNKTKSAYIGEVYEYSYDFRNKTQAQITADGWTVVSGSASFNSNGLYSTSIPFRLKKAGFLTHIANANKVTLTLNYNLAAGNIYGAMAKTFTSSGGTGISGTTTDLVGTQQRSLVVYQDATRVSGMAAGMYTTKIILDFVNKTARGTITGYADITRTLTDTEISNIKGNTDLLMIFITSGNSSNYISDISLIVEK